MIRLEDFEGITGFRWGVWIQNDGRVLYGAQAPPSPENKIRLISKVITQAPINLYAADLIFEKGMILIRQGIYGMLLLFCEDKINVSMVDIVLDQSICESSAPIPNAASLDDPNEEQLTPVTTLDLDSELVPRRVIESLLDLYSEFLGPLARKLANRDARKAELELRRLPASDWSKLLEMMAARFDNQSKRDKFLARAYPLQEDVSR